jgi:hypothetical protein
MFFVFGLKDVEEDAAYVRGKYFPDFDYADPEIAKGTRLKHQRLSITREPQARGKPREWRIGHT